MLQSQIIAISGYIRSVWPITEHYLGERPGLALTILLTLFSILAGKPSLALAKVQRTLVISMVAPLALIFDVYRFFRRIAGQLIHRSSVLINTTSISDTDFPGLQEFERMLAQLEKSGLRSTASKAHETFIRWIREEVAQVPSLIVTEDEYEILRWQTKDGASLHDAGQLLLGKHAVPIAGAVPYSSLTVSSGVSGQLCYLPHNARFHSGLKGKIILRDLSSQAVFSALGFLPGYSRTSDLNRDLLSMYDRPSFWSAPCTTT